MRTIKERLARIEAIQYFILALVTGQLGVTYIPLLIAILL